MVHDFIAENLDVIIIAYQIIAIIIAIIAIRAYSKAIGENTRSQDLSEMLEYELHKHLSQELNGGGTVCKIELEDFVRRIYKKIKEEEEHEQDTTNCGDF